MGLVFLIDIELAPIMVFMIVHCTHPMIVFLPLVCKFTKLKDCLFHHGVSRAEYSSGYKVDIKLIITMLNYLLTLTKSIRKSNLSILVQFWKGMTVSYRRYRNIDYLMKNKVTTLKCFLAMLDINPWSIIIHLHISKNALEKEILKKFSREVYCWTS